GLKHRTSHDREPAPFSGHRSAGSSGPALRFTHAACADLTVCRYVERNAFTAELTSSPEAWRWGSLYRWTQGTAREKQLLAACPLKRRSDGCRHVATVLSDRERERLRWSVKRGAPYGEETWTEFFARRFDLESTMRPRGRPRKFPQTAQ